MALSSPSISLSACHSSNALYSTRMFFMEKQAVYNKCSIEHEHEGNYDPAARILHRKQQNQKQLV